MSATAYDVHGDGAPVILIHGLGLNRAMWQWQLPALSAKFQVVCYDLLGHGDSPKPAGPYTMEQMVAQLDDLMIDLDISRAALVGFSLGGLINRAFALAHPRKTTALVILNSAHARTAAQRDSIELRVRQAKDSGPAATVDAALERWFSEEFASRKPQVLEQVRRWVIANDASVYPDLYRLLAEGDKGLETEISAIDCPTLIVTGEEDHGNSPEMTRQMAALMPNARAEILPGLRHMALVEDPATINGLLVEFLQRKLSSANS